MSSPSPPIAASALIDGKVYLGTLDGHLVALNAETGKNVLDVSPWQDPTNSFYTDGAGAVSQSDHRQGQLLLGVSNGDWGGIGNISAFDPETGHRLWQLNTVPGVGEPGHDTWSGDSLEARRCCGLDGVAIDPQPRPLPDRGNPQPDFTATVRMGRQPYSDSWSR